LLNQAPAAINARVNDLAEKPCCPFRDPWRLCLAATVIVAVVIRIIDASLRWPIADRDMFVFLQQARSLLQGDWYSWFAIHTKPPLYSLLVAIPAALGMELLPAGKLVSLLAGIAILHPAWLNLRRLGDRWTALLALAAVAVMPEGVRLAGRGISDTLSGLVMLYAMYFLLVRGLTDGKVWALGASGLLVGLAYLTRTEGLMFLPFGLLLIAGGAVARKLPRKTAWWGGLAFAGGSVLLVALHVGAISHQEGKLTFRRNMGHFMLYSAGLEKNKKGKEISETEAVRKAWPMLLKGCAANFAQYLYDYVPRYTGYVAAFFLPLGLWADRKLLFKWGPWQLGLLVFLLGLLGVSLIAPHTRFLVGLIWLASWPMARGMIATAEWLIGANPLKLHRTAWVRAALPSACLAAMLGITAGAWASIDRSEVHAFSAAGAAVREDWHGRSATFQAATSSPDISWYAGAQDIPLKEAVTDYAANERIPFDEKHPLDLPQFQDFLRQCRADYLVCDAAFLAETCKDLSPQAPPPFLKTIRVIPFRVRGSGQGELFVFRVALPPLPKTLPSTTSASPQLRGG
jgi:hypothetical protein